tara:strand:- start:102 stop:431 length:330 start_codon:yes stop_codon:yes gene_type:complete
MSLQKEQRIKSKKHLEYITTLQCAAISSVCSGPVQAHHLLRPWVGSRGMGMKADDRNAIPLCQYHHGVLHTQYGSERAFFEIHGRRPEWASQFAEALWHSSPHNLEKEN